MRWSEISIETPDETTEAVTAALLAIGCQGVAERLGAAPRVMKGFLPETEDIAAKIAVLRERLSHIEASGLAPAGEPAVRDVQESDWANEWKRYYKPLEIGRRLAIKPSWEPYEATGDRVVVEIDPGMAFGTGGHATTRLCLAALEELIRPGMVVADIGTGSGILALAAARLGAGLVHATDIDSLPRKIARENVEAAGLGAVVRIEEMDGFDGAARNCDLVVANIIADTIVEIAPSVFTRIKAGGLFVASGIVEERLPDVLAALEAAGFRLVETREEDIWRATIATVPGDV